MKYLNCAQTTEDIITSKVIIITKNEFFGDF